ncbi:MAG: hypothetical protein ABIG30_03470 [Candidatus Aenigmatarchaeota archaeon]
MLLQTDDGTKLNVKDCTQTLSSMKGLMFSRLRDIDGALVKGNIIWMPFCKPLDLFFLDKDFNFLEKQPAAPLTLNPKSWKTYSCKAASYCLELRPGLIKSLKKIRVVSN